MPGAQNLAAARHHDHPPFLLRESDVVELNASFRRVYSNDLELFGDMDHGHTRPS